MASDRNFGCRIKRDLVYKGYETVIMENELFRLMLLPGKGSDVIELLHKPSDTDFCWLTHLGLRRREPVFADFQSQYEGGWQEILPNIGGEDGGEGMVPLERYGEASLSEWDWSVVQDDPEQIKVRLSYTLRTLPLKVEKAIVMSAMSPGFTMEETVVNEAPARIDFDWGHHITFGTPFLQPGTRVELPGPYASCVTPERGGAGGFAALPVDEGRYRLVRPDGIGAQVSWDRETWPYLWFWRDFGESSAPPYYGLHYNVGLELFSSPPGTLTESIERGTALRLEPHGSRSARLVFSVIREGDGR